jgi:hypothetical protein
MISGNNVHMGDPRVAAMRNEMLRALEKCGEKIRRAAIFPDFFL